MTFESQLSATAGKAPPVQRKKTETADQDIANPVWSQVATAVDTEGDNPAGLPVTATPDAGVMDAGADTKDAGTPAPTDAGTELPAGVARPLPTGPDACTTNEEEDRKNAFRLKSFSLKPYQPSTGLGLFDAYYWPVISMMMAVSKFKFKFVQADNTPDFFTLFSMFNAGQDITRFFWNDAQKKQFEQDYVRRVSTRWSLQHTFQSNKPCWPFMARPIVSPVIVDSDADAHFKINVHKSPGPGIDYKSLLRPPVNARGQGSGEMHQSDLQDNPDFRSQNVARSERKRIERALAASLATPVMFDKDSKILRPASKTVLASFATALKAKNPSDPLIPLFLSGFASAEGGNSHNFDLSLDRAEAVELFLKSQGVSQPLSAVGFGPQGAPDDAANRKVDIEVDRTFETTYAGNRYSVGEHEFGHALGLSDEYRNNTAGRLGNAQTAMDTLARAAGVAPPDPWGDRTSSIMASGVDVLPRHYLTLWEALGAMTTPDISQNEWEIK